MHNQHVKKYGIFKMKVLVCLGLSAALLAGCGGSGDSKGNDCTLGVNSCNVAPVAKVTATQAVLVGSTVTLDGSASFDANNDPISYNWTILQTPNGSTATLASTTSAKTTFVPLNAGIYVITLVVSDGKSSSALATTTVTASATNLTINSTSYTNGGTIPLRIAGTAVGGSNITPQLNISDVPDGTKRFAIIMDDETAPCQAGISACRHWGVFNLPIAKTAIAEGEDLLLQSGVVYGSNYTIGPGGAAGIGYSGPAATSQHTYKLTVYALNDSVTWVTAVPEFSRAKFELDFKAFIIGKATLTGVFP
jgi:Raf kinase inhibitor-like YbhB/YbcL family protein